MMDIHIEIYCNTYRIYCNTYLSCIMKVNCCRLGADNIKSSPAPSGTSNCKARHSSGTIVT